MNSWRNQLEIARRLRRARTLAGLSEGQAASLLSLHRSTLVQIEAGRRRVLADELTTLADVYGVSAGWLSGEEGSNPEVLKIAARQFERMSTVDRERLATVIEAVSNP